MASRGQSGGEARRLRELLEKAKQLGRDGNKGPEAIWLNTEILDRDPEEVGSYIRRGTCYLATDYLDAAKKDFEKALALDPNNRFAINRLNEIKDRPARKSGQEHTSPSTNIQRGRVHKRGRQRNASSKKTSAPRRKRPTESLPEQPIWVYHFTPIENLPGILGSDGLRCSNRCTTQQVTVAHQHIQNRRSRKWVPCWPGGNLHDYVPFYFCCRSPMMYAINVGAVSSYDRGQYELVYLVLKLQSVAETGLDFVFTDRHAVTDHAAFYTDPADLSRVDWDLMSSRWWSDTPSYPDRKERRQAEFLVHKFVPWGLVEFLAVMTPYMKQRVENLIAQYPTPSRKPVLVKQDWYY